MTLHRKVPVTTDLTALPYSGRDGAIMALATPAPARDADKVFPLLRVEVEALRDACNEALGER